MIGLQTEISFLRGRVPTRTPCKAMFAQDREIMSLTTEQVTIVKSTALVLAEHGDHITKVFYKKLFQDYPDLNNVFNHSNQVNDHQAKALAASLYAYASHIDDLGALSPAVEKICHKHASLYIQPDQYDVVGNGLIRAMAAVLGDACTPAILEAWTAAYWQLAKIMIRQEEQIYGHFEGWTNWRDFVIADKVKESEEITSLYLTPVDHQPLPSFRPGQYVSVLVDVPSFGYQQSRQYSLSDAPAKEYYRISVKRESTSQSPHDSPQTRAGWVSNILDDEKIVGDHVKLSHPTGDFFYDAESDQNGPIVLLSAGVGITPMMSILNTLVSYGSKQQIRFIHGARSSTVRAFANQVREQDRTNENVRTIIFIKNPIPGKDVEGVHYDQVGRLELSKLDSDEDLCLNDKMATYFICGPEAFMTQICSDLEGTGVSEERIKMEVFGTGALMR